MTLRNCDVRTFLERTRGKKIVCFGAGLWSEKLTEYFPSYRIETAFSYIVDNNAALWGAKKVIGSKALEIHSPEKLYGEADGDTVVLITIANAAE